MKSKTLNHIHKSKKSINREGRSHTFQPINCISQYLCHVCMYIIRKNNPPMSMVQYINPFQVTEATF